VSQGGDQWDRWKNWVPGDPAPGELPPDAPTRRPSQSPLPPPPAGPGVARVAAPAGPVAGAPTAGAGGRGIVAVVAALVLLAGAGAVVYLASATTIEPAPTVVIDGDPVAVPVTEGDLTVTSLPAHDVEVDLLRGDLRPALDLLQAEVGGTFRVQQLVVYPGYVVASIEPPALPGELDSWTVYPPDRASGPTAQSNPGDVEASLFRVDELDLVVLASLPDRAEAELALPDAAAGYAIVERDAWRDGALTVRVYVRSERRTGYVTFAATGEVLDVYGG
jgi:hypothetical protein